MINLEQQLNDVSSDYILVQTPDEFGDLTDKIRSSSQIAVHIETTGQDFFSDQVTDLWIGTAVDEPVILIQLDFLPAYIRGKLWSIFRSTSIDKIFLNAVSACTFLNNNRLPVEGFKFDILTVHNILNSGQLKKDFGLIDLAETYLGRGDENLLSEVEINNSGDARDFNRVAAYLNSLFPLREKLTDTLNINGLLDTLELESACIDVACQLNTTGIRLNYGELRKDFSEIEKERCRCKKEAEYFLTDNFNIDGTTTLKHDLNRHPKTIEKNIKIDDTKKETLKSIAPKLHGVQSILNYRSAKNQSRTISRILNSIRSETGRVHFLYNPLSGVNSSFSCTSQSLKSIYSSEKFTHCFQPEEGRVIIKGHYPDLKLRIIAELCSDDNMIEAHKGGYDFIQRTAFSFFGRRTRISKAEMNFIGSMVYKFIFGNDATVFSDRELYFKKEFFDEYKDLLKWKENIGTGDNTVVRSRGGRIKEWNDYNPSQNKILNATIQATFVDITKRALWQISKKLHDEYGKIIGFLRNDILVEADKEYIDLATDYLSESMVEAGKFYLHEVPVKVDICNSNFLKYRLARFR